MMLASSNSSVTVGFGKAALGPDAYEVATMALEEGFRRFDTAEVEWWYDQKQVGRALSDFFAIVPNDADIDNQECIASADDGADGCDDGGSGGGIRSCASQDLRISTKIPPWSLTDVDAVRSNAAHSRQELLGFCEDEVILNEDALSQGRIPFLSTFITFTHPRAGKDSILATTTIWPYWIYAVLVWTWKPQWAWSIRLVELVCLMFIQMISWTLLTLFERDKRLARRIRRRDCPMLCRPLRTLLNRQKNRDCFIKSMESSLFRTVILGLSIVIHHKIRSLRV
jgi:hypothetical protein